MRLLVLCLLCALIITPARAQDRAGSTARAVPPPTALRLPFAHRPGDRSTVRVVKSRAERDAGVLVDSVSGVWDVTMRVLAIRPRGYTMAWTYTRPGVHDDGRRAHYDLVTNTLEGIPIVFRTDAKGQPYEIANGDSLRAAINTAMGAKTPPLGSESRALFDNVLATVSTDAGLEDLLLADVERYHLASGGRYPADHAVTYRSALPNPFGGAAIPAVASFRVERMTPGDTVATVRWRQTPDTQALARILVDLLNEVTPGRAPLTTDEVMRRFGIEEKATYRIGTQRGQVWSVRYAKAVRFGDRVKTERVAMEIVPRVLPSEGNRGMR